MKVQRLLSSETGRVVKEKTFNERHSANKALEPAAFKTLLLVHATPRLSAKSVAAHRADRS